ISTKAGMWRYKIGDPIKFTSLSPYRFKISGRTKQYINTIDEEVTLYHADQELRAACDATAAIIKDYTARPVYFNNKDAGAHEWIIEFEKQPGDFNQFCDILDNTLREINSDYDAKRYKNMALAKPIIHNAPDKT